MLRTLLCAAALCAASAGTASASRAGIVILDTPEPTELADDLATLSRFRETPPPPEQTKAEAEAAAADKGGEEKEKAAGADAAAAPAKDDAAAAAGAAAAAPAAPSEFAPAKKGFQPTCDMAVDSGICLFGGKRVLLPVAPEKRLVGWYTFDSSHGVDNSGFQNHAVGVSPTGPGRLGLGNSAYMDGDVWVEVPWSESLGQATRRASAVFWVYVRPDADFTADAECPLALFGGKEAAWQVAFNPKQRVLTASALKGAVSVRSFAKLRVAQWTQVALTVGADRLTLYVNGVPDASAPISASVDPGPYESLNFYAGRSPWAPAQCHVPLLLDDVKVFARAVTAYEVGASSFPSLGVADPAFVRLGKPDATLEDAQKACTDTYHLCVKNELYAGALQTARAMGWISGNSKVWEGGVDATAGEEKKTALCCADE